MTDSTTAFTELSGASRMNAIINGEPKKVGVGDNVIPSNITQESPSPIVAPVERPSSVDVLPELDWNINPDDLTKLFSDSNERERVRRLLNSAAGTATHSESSRVELASIKAQLAHEAENKQGVEFSQAEIDNMQRSKGNMPDGTF